jgi:hypothetical protein
MSATEAERIAAFWAWFAANLSAVLSAYGDGDADWLDEHLSPAVEAIEPRLNWEIGPYHHPEDTLVISPGVRENISLTERVVAASPPTPGWHFLPAKPPKKLQRLVIGLPGVEGAEVDADSWVYRLTAYNQMEFFDIDVYADNVGPMADNDLELLTRELVEALVGERHFLELIAAVQVWRYPEDRPPGKLTRLPLLGSHLAHLLQQRPESGPSETKPPSD